MRNTRRIGPVAIRLAVTVLIVLGPPGPGEARTADAPPEIGRKLIHFGWGMPDTRVLRAEVREMEQYPFDGITFRIKGKRPDGSTVAGYYPITQEKWDEAWFANAAEDIRRIRFEKFTHNFIDLETTPADVDWFNDEHWAAACHNVQIMVKLARPAGCRGVVFDAELYGPNPHLWRPPPLQNDPSRFDEYARAARRRGRQWIEAVGREMPDATVLSVFLVSFVGKNLDPSDPEVMQHVATDNYALLPAFTNGMLDGLLPGMTIVDGNEAAYKYRSAEQFDASRQLMKEKVLPLIAPENRRTYREQFQAGQAIYMDIILAGRAPVPVEMKQFEDNVYHALRTADEYAWCYSEAWLWWPRRLRRVPTGSVEAILNARDRLAGVEPALRRDLAAVAPSPTDIKLPAARITALPANVSGPTLDGMLTDPAWRHARKVGPFRTLRLGKPLGQTEAQVTFDGDNLYVAFVCHEPHMAEIKRVGKKRDDPVPQGDSVNVLIAKGLEPAPFFHFCVNPDNVKWDARSNIQWDKLADDLAAFNGQWRSAVAENDEGWTVEMAIPWQDMGMKAPAPGTALRANLGRKRWARGWETISWAPQMRGSGFEYGVELYRFGTWTFENSR